MEPTIIQYIRDRKGRKVGLMYANKTEDGIIEVGYSAANAKAGDKFRKDRGLGMAKARAEKLGKQVRAKLAYYMRMAEKDQEIELQRQEIRKEILKTKTLPSKPRILKRTSNPASVNAAQTSMQSEIVVGPGYKRQLDKFIARCGRYYKGDKIYAITVSQANILEAGEECKITKIFGGECDVPGLEELKEKLKETDFEAFK